MPRSVAFGAVALGVVGLGTGAAVSVTQFLQPDALTFSCVLGDGTDGASVNKRATVADPLQACREEWPAGAEVPELAVFMDGEGAVYVASTSWVAPPEWGTTGREITSVAQDVAFDPMPARLQAALDDWIDGLESDCFSHDQAVAKIDTDLQRLGMVGWTVRYEDNGGREEPADGVADCASAYIDGTNPAAREIHVRGAIDGSEEWHLQDLDEAELRALFTESYRSGVEAGQEQYLSEEEQVAKDVSTQLSLRTQLEALRKTFPEDRCLTAEQAEQEATRVLDPSWAPVVDVSTDDNLDCATVEASLGGTWLISIVGPTTVPDE